MPAGGRDLDAAEDELRRLARAKNLIPGVYNYCDRWCERCPLTARCLVFQAQQARAKRVGRARNHDADNQDFWDDLGESLALAMHMVRRDAKRLGIDIDNPSTLAEARADERLRRRRAAREGSALRRLAAAYRKEAKALLDRLPAELSAVEDALNVQARLGAGDPHADAEGLRDALEVAQWYMFFIEVKLGRAVSSRVDLTIEGDDGFLRDSDGSAKVALVAIDRSLAAWARLRRSLEGEADTMLDLLAKLVRLRRAVEREFPEARAFKRPGFD